MKNETKWSIDLAHSEIEFKVRHLMISSVRGSFKNFDASIYTTGKDFTTAEIDIWIDASSISTNDRKRDEHLMSADFFNVKEHKQIIFTSSTIEESDLLGHHELWGYLTMNGITKHIMLDVMFGGTAKDASGIEKAGFTVTGSFNRNDWELHWNQATELGGLLVGEEVKINCEIELINQGVKDLIMVLNSTASQDGLERK